MEGFIVLILLVFLGFLGFSVFFIFKQLQFVLQAVNLYKEMIQKQEESLKILKEINNNLSK